MPLNFLGLAPLCVCVLHPSYNTSRHLVYLRGRGVGGQAGVPAARFLGHAPPGREHAGLEDVQLGREQCVQGEGGRGG